MDNYTSDPQEKVREWNSELVRSLVPNNVILSLYMFTGLVGNSTVIFIYGFKMRGNKEDRYFIPFLATADLLASLVCASFGIAQNVMQATFDDEHLCKAWWFSAGFTTLTSVFFLLIIAVHRYLKVCKPLGKQMTLKWKRGALCVGLTVAFTLSVPMSHFYGSESFLNDERQIHGLRCGRLSTTNKTGSLIFGGVIVLTAITLIVALICLYSKIGYTILEHFKYTKTVGKRDKIDHSQSGLSSSDDPLSDTEHEIHSIETDNTGFSATYTSQAFEHPTGNIQTRNIEHRGNPLPKLSSTKRRKNRKVVHKFTLMFMLITIIFLICYIPKVIIMLLEASNTKFWEGFTDSGRSGVLFVYRIYILNTVTNPFIYAFLDNKFTKEIKAFCKSCKKL
ncbi:cholecystokinin receptor-like [Ostrea edulis]|uniref:cholecystokinin receptor-like n=1 Tax=Ostrea edulis TaxID=37623 RepID=UPI0024AEFB19|nr:cholecystokinin receptor-like [Ostrea edulis]